MIKWHVRHVTGVRGGKSLPSNICLQCNACERDAELPIYGNDNSFDILIFRLLRAEHNILHVVAIFPDPI